MDTLAGEDRIKNLVSGLELRLVNLDLPFQTIQVLQFLTCSDTAAEYGNLVFQIVVFSVDKLYGLLSKLIAHILCVQHVFQCVPLRCDMYLTEQHMNGTKQRNTAKVYKRPNIECLGVGAGVKGGIKSGKTKAAENIEHHADHKHAQARWPGDMKLHINLTLAMFQRNHDPVDSAVDEQHKERFHHRKGENGNLLLIINIKLPGQRDRKTADHKQPYPIIQELRQIHRAKHRDLSSCQKCKSGHKHIEQPAVLRRGKGHISHQQDQINSVNKNYFPASKSLWIRDQIDYTGGPVSQSRPVEGNILKFVTHLDTSLRKSFTASRNGFFFARLI